MCNHALHSIMEKINTCAYNYYISNYRGYIVIGTYFNLAMKCLEYRCKKS